MIKKSLFIHLSFAAIALCLFYSCGVKTSFSIEGTIKNKVQGKDGYTAYIQGDNGKTYLAVISRVNMAYTLEYQDLALGEHVKLYGDTTNLGVYTSITVSKIEKK